MVDIGNLMGGEIGINFTINLWQFGFLLLVCVVAGYLYNRWIVNTANSGRYVPTWQMVVIGVVMGLVALFIISWPVAVLVFAVYASLGLFLAWGDDRREREAALDYARHLRSKSKILKHLPGADEE